MIKIPNRNILMLRTEVTQKLYDTLTGIQWGKIEDPFGWRIEVK